MYQRLPSRLPLAQADCAHLRQRAERPRRPAPGVLHARDERRRDCPQSDQQDAETPARRRNRCPLSGDEVLCFQNNPFLPGERHQRLLPLRRDPARARPVFDSTLPFPQQIRQRTLPPKPANNPLRRIKLIGFHAVHHNEFFVTAPAFDNLLCRPVDGRPTNPPANNAPSRSS